MPADRDSVFLFSYFKGHGDGLHLAWSTDGLYWQAMNDDQPFIRGNAGEEKLMRDPFLLPAEEGVFHLVWTAGWRGNGIGYSSSRDLRNWSPQRFIPVMAHEPLAQNCWAPEIFYLAEKNVYMIYWATSIRGRFPETDKLGDEGLDHRMYCVTTPDFRSFSEPKLFFDGGFNVIDATLVRENEGYLLFMKDETSNPCQKNIRMAVAESLSGGFKDISQPITGEYWAEGPTAIKIGDRWIVYFDKYKVGGIGAVTSRDLTQWEDISDQIRLPSGAQHGSVIRVALERIKHLL